MKHLKRLIQLIINALARRLKLYGTPDTDKAIRVLKVENLALKKERTEMQQELKQRPGFTTVYIDALMRQRGYEQSAWAEPERHTTPRPVLGIRQRAVTRQLQQQPGMYWNHDRRMREQKERAHQTDPLLTQAALPRMPHKPNLMLHSGLYPGETAHSTPAFLQDQDKKIS